MTPLRSLTLALTIALVALAPSVVASSGDDVPPPPCGDPLDGVLPYTNCMAGLLAKDVCVIIFGAEACKLNQ